MLLSFILYLFKVIILFHHVQFIISIHLNLIIIYYFPNFLIFKSHFVINFIINFIVYFFMLIIFITL